MQKPAFETRTHLHFQIRDRIKSFIEQNGCRRGDPIPSLRTLCSRFDVSLVTVKRAMDELVKEKIVYGRPGKGMFVGKELSPEARTLTEVGLIFTGTRQLFFSQQYINQIFQGIVLESDNYSADVTIYSIKSGGKPSAQEIEESGADGIIMLGTPQPDYLRELVKENIPVVVADNIFLDIPLEYVACDNMQAAERIVEHLYSNGHRSIGYLSSGSVEHRFGNQPDPFVETSDNIERREGVMNAALNSSMTVHAYPIPKEDLSMNVKNAIDAWTEQTPRPTAVITDHVGMAVNVIKELKSRGIKVPDDVSVAGVAGSGDTVIDDLAVSYSCFDFQEMGRQAVKLLEKRIKSLRPVEASVSRIDSRFIIGNTIENINT
jgi:GntR family transcriptional regulator of arabinose operon